MSASNSNTHNRVVHPSEPGPPSTSTLLTHFDVGHLDVVELTDLDNPNSHDTAFPPPVPQFTNNIMSSEEPHIDREDQIATVVAYTMAGVAFLAVLVLCIIFFYRHYKYKSRPRDHRHRHHIHRRTPNPRHRSILPTSLSNTFLPVRGHSTPTSPPPTPSQKESKTQVENSLDGDERRSSESTIGRLNAHVNGNLRGHGHAQEDIQLEELRGSLRVPEVAVVR